MEDAGQEDVSRDRRRSSQSSTGSHAAATTFRTSHAPINSLSAFKLSTVAPVDRAFNPLNPRGETSGQRRERESSNGSDAPMQLDFSGFDEGMVKRQSSSGSPVLLEPPTSSPGLPRTRSSPQLVNPAPSTGQATPPQQQQRRFASAEPPGPETEQLEPPLSPASSTGRAAGPAVKRVSRRGSLYPKPKGFMRVAAQLQTDGAAVPDAEAAQEAAIFRAAKSGPSSINVECSVFAGRAIPSTSGKPSLSNRFPEQAGEEDPKLLRVTGDSSGSDEETGGSDAFSRGADGMQLDEENAGSPYDDQSGADQDAAAASRRRIAALWSLRDTTRPSPRLNLGDFDHSPSTPGWSSGSGDRRPNKRKADDNRFEPYSSLAFKRRAVSPTASSIAGSPVLAAQTTSAHLPTPSPGPSISLPHSSFFSAMRSGSPSPAAAGIGFIPPPFAGLTLPRDDEEVLKRMSIE